MNVKVFGKVDGVGSDKSSLPNKCENNIHELLAESIAENVFGDIHDGKNGFIESEFVEV